MASWRLARSLEVLREQINAAFPGRSKVSDGTLGDRAHAARKSDHNPNRAGVVQALDITHDPRKGLDAGAVANALRLSQDPRIKYLISNGRIAGGANFNWRPYSGSNPHRQHFHVSVKDQKGHYDNPNNWQIEPVYGFMNVNLSDDVLGEPIDEYGIMGESPEAQPGFLRRNWELSSGTGMGLGGVGLGGLFDPTIWIIAGAVFVAILVVVVGLFLWLKPDREKIKRWIWRKLK